MEHLTPKEQASLIMEIFHSIENLYEQYAKSVGMSYLSFLVLDVIYTMPENCTQKLICDRTHLTKQNVNAIVKTFWTQGYIEMKELPYDRRNKGIWLTASGKEYADKIMLRLAEAEEKAMGYEKRIQMIEILKQVESTLKHEILKLI